MTDLRDVSPSKVTFSIAPERIQDNALQDLRLLFQAAYGDTYPLNIIKPNDRYADPIEFFLARAGTGAVVGSCGVQIYTNPSGAVHIAISRLARHPDFAHLGVGRKLLQSVLRWAEETYAEHDYVLTAEVLSSNRPSIELFELFGFGITCVWHEARKDYLTDNQKGAAERYVDYMQMTLSGSAEATSQSEEEFYENFSYPAQTRVMDEFSTKTSTAFIFESDVAALPGVIHCCKRYIKAGIIPAILAPYRFGQEFTAESTELSFGGIYIFRGQIFDFLAYTKESLVDFGQSAAIVRQPFAYQHA